MVAGSSTSRWILLPGLDGTGILFGELLKHLPAGVDAVVVRYPKERRSSTSELMRLVDAALPAEGRYALIAESFSGPLALRAIGNSGRIPVALILCASFGRSPIPLPVCGLMSLVAPAAVHWKIPRSLVRRYLAGNRDRVIHQFRIAIAGVSGAALASRFKALGEFTDSFVPKTLRTPVLYIRATEDRLVHKRELTWLQSRYSVTARDVRSPHLVLQCQPKSVVGLITEFLRSVGSSSGTAPPVGEQENGGCSIR